MNALLISSLKRLMVFTVAWMAAAVMAQPANDPATHPFAASQPIAGQYIVVFKSTVGNPSAQALSLVRGAGPSARLQRTFSTAIKGFAATLPAAALQGIRNNPNVDFIEQDQTVSLVATQTQSPATWGLDRIDDRALMLNSIYNYDYDGTGVTAFIIDTGILASHVDFGGRVRPGFTAVADGRGTEDCNGHGTHVAGTVGGTTWGVAKNVTLVPVRVLNCRGSGSLSGVVAGVDWVAAQKASVGDAVANMSLGSSFSASVNAAVAGAVAQGVTVVVAAGNSNANACSYSPSSEPSAITVGATTNTDARASYSNYGSCVDVFAPGSSIKSNWYTSTTATNTISGTSMASPHVAGVAALAAQANPGATPAVIANLITSTATVGVVSSAGSGSLNLLLYSRGGTDSGGGGTPPPVVDVTITGITGVGVKVSRKWRAEATVTVGTVSGNSPVSGATVTGSFSPGGAATCVTSTAGTCKLTSATISSGSMTVLSVTNVSGTNLNYTGGTVQYSIFKP